jgi:uncharacterized protein
MEGDEAQAHSMKSMLLAAVARQNFRRRLRRGESAKLSADIPPPHGDPGRAAPRVNEYLRLPPSVSEKKSVKKLLVTVTLLTSSLLTFSAMGQTTPEPASEAAAPQAPTEQNIDPEKEKLIRDLLTKTREVEMAEERIFQGVAAMKQVMPNVPEKYWDEYRKRIRGEELRNRLIAIYASHFSTDDVKALLAFFATPAGKKWTAERVPMLRDSMEVAQEITRHAAAEVSKEFRSDQLLKNPRGLGRVPMPPVGKNPFADTLSQPLPSSPAASAAPSP